MKASVIIPTRNRLRLLQRAIASVDAQTLRDVETLVIDDASADGTAEWLSEQTRLRAFRNDAPRGASAARNLGIRNASGELVAFLDDDDEWQPSYLEAQARRLEECPAAVLTYSDFIEANAGARASRPDTRPAMKYDSQLTRMLAEAFIHTMSIVVCRRSVFEKYGLFDERLAIVHDLEWYVRLLAAGERFEHVDRALVSRTVPGGLVANHRDWFDEERGVIDAGLARTAVGRTARLVRCSRSLFFAQLALSRGDVRFGLPRLLDAFATAPWSSTTIAARRLARRLAPRERPEPVDTTVSALP